MNRDIFEFVTTEETAFKTTPVTVADGFDWCMYEHIRHCVLVKDGRLLQGDADMTPVRNIVLPIVNVAYRTEGFDVKDIEPYVNDEENYHKSFLVRKFHEKWARDEGLDTFIDEVVESYVDFGGALVKKVGRKAEVIPLQKLAFCDQTDIMGGPFCIKHNYSIDQLMERSGVWDKEGINAVIDYARAEKSNTQANGNKTKTPGKYIEVYEVHGVFPDQWLEKDTTEYVKEEGEGYSRQVHIVCYGVEVDGQKKGITLFKGKEEDGLFKVLKRDGRYGTALGRSAIEELFEPQAWVNYSLIQKKAMLDKLAMILGVTDDATFASRNRFTDLEAGEWMVKAPGSTAEPFVFPAVNLNAFGNETVEWEQHARTLGSASDPALGLNPSSGTPLGTTQIVTTQGQGIHEYRQGKVAAFIQECYRDWFLQTLVEDMDGGQKFIAELSIDELQEVCERMVTNHSNGIVKRKMLEGKIPTEEERAALSEVLKQDFMKGGQKRFHEIVKGELGSIPTDVFVNVAAKQKNQPAMVEKLSNFLRGVLSNPAILQDPNAAKVVNMMLDASGLSPINFTFNQGQSQMVQGQAPQMQQPQLMQ